MHPIKNKNNERIIICIKMIRSLQYHEPVRWECESIHIIVGIDMFVMFVWQEKQGSCYAQISWAEKVSNYTKGMENEIYNWQNTKKTHTEAGICTCRLTAHLKTDAAFIMTRVRSALVFSLKPFVKTNITHITMERLVFVYPKKTKQNQQLFPTATDLIISRKLDTNKKNTLP